MPSKPKELFWVEYVGNGAQYKGRYYRHHGAPKGGTFSTLAAALLRAAYVRQQYPDATVTVWRTGQLNWTEHVTGFIE